VAYQILGSCSDAHDAVQKAWLRLNRSDAADLDKLPAWLTIVVARCVPQELGVCCLMRSR
jgi:RNA polymerase sigma-70 factor (ECF subfamily)